MANGSGGEATTPVPELPSPTRRGLAPLVATALNTTSAVLVVVGSLVVIGRGPGEPATASLFGPGESLLASDPRGLLTLWAIIVAMIGFTVWVWLPVGQQSERMRRIAWPGLLAGSAHLAWVVVGRAGLVVPTVVLLLVELVALCVVVWQLVRHQAGSWPESLATDTGWGLTLGFVAVQLLVSAGLAAQWFDFDVDDREHLIIAITAYGLFIIGALGLAGRMYRQYAVGAALLWGFAWLGWARLVGEPRNYVLGGLAIFGCFILFAAFYASARRRRDRVPGLIWV